jgi:hypothetical protein
MAAGLGFKTFTTGEVLTAADTNGYLMQGILVFASEAARDAAITSPQEGQFAFTKDNNSLWYYDGAAWVASGATGDIEGVTAGTGISGGGTSGTVTITNSMATEIDAKGDLVVGTGADTFARLAVGTNDYVLTADSVEATGLKWASAAASFNTGYSFTSGSQNTSSSTYVDLSTVTSTTVTTGTKALVAIKSRMGNEAVGAGVWAHCSFAVSGATTIAAADERSISGYFTYAGQWISEVGAAFVVTGLTAGSNTFTLKFNAQGGYATPATFYDRSISVVNLGS